jgi:hypothetical protein
LSFVRSRLPRALIIIAVIALVWCVAQAAELAGVPVPDTEQVNGKTLYLNGFGLRTFSILGVHIYVAALYLERLSTDAGEIIGSPETKLLTVKFVRSITVGEARKAWAEGLENNCTAPCRLDPEDVERFLASMPAMHVGDDYFLVFTPNGATVTSGGQLIATISKRQFARAMLAMFLGPKPASPMLKQDLLRGHG